VETESLYAAGTEDLGPGDFVKVDCEYADDDAASDGDNRES